MLDFGFSEILLTSAIALVVLGPERLPKVARQVGNWMGRARAMARQLSEQLEREVSADELLKTQSRKLEAPPPNRIAPPERLPPAPTAHAEYEPPAVIQPIVTPPVVTAPVAATNSHLPPPAEAPPTPHVEVRIPPNE
jgi:Tat protein translocase TatB subunit